MAKSQENHFIYKHSLQGKEARSHIYIHGPKHSRATENIVFAFFLNLIFAIIELIGGLLTNSVAIISDAVHDFGDSLSFGVTWYLQKKSEKGRDDRYSYGYKRYSTMGAMFISVVMMIGSIFIIREAVVRFFEPQEPNAYGMFWLAILGLVVNGIAALRLRKGRSITEKAVKLHMMEDFLGWAAVLVASVVMIFVYAPILDPLLSILIACWVLFNVFRNLKSILKIILQQIPSNVDLVAVKRTLLELEQVDSLHDVHLWTMDGEQNIMTAHIVIIENYLLGDLSELKCKIREICAGFGISHVTIEFELSGELCEEGARCDL